MFLLRHHKSEVKYDVYIQAQYDKAMSHKQMLVEDAETCRRKMTNAMALIEGLGGEKVFLWKVLAKCWLNIEQPRYS